MTIQDQDRFIWILSEKGILKYDGADFKSFTVSEGLPINDIWYIKEDRSGKKWLGGFFDGLFYIKDDIVHEVPCGTKNNSLLFTSENADTMFFTSIDERKSYFMLRGMKKLEEVKLASNQTIKIRLDDKIIINENDSKNNEQCNVQFHQNGASFSFSGAINWRNAILKMNQQFLENYKDGELSWILTNGATAKVIDPTAFLEEPVVTVNTLQPGGQLIIQFKTGTHVYKNLSERVHDISLERRISNFKDRQISWAVIDDEQNIWFTIDRNTIEMLPRGTEHINQFQFEKKNRKNYIHPIVKNNKLIFHVLKRGLYSYDLSTNALTNIFQVDNKRINGVFDLKSTSNGYYFLTPKSIYFQPDQGVLQKYPISDEITNPFPRLFIPNGKEQFVVNDFSTYYLEDGIAKQNSIINNGIRATYLKESPDYWIVSTAEELIFCNKKTKLNDHVAISGAQCIQTIEDKVLVGTSGHGLILTDQSGEIYSKLHEEKSINDILIYKKRYVISATNYGISIDRIDKNKGLHKHKFIGVEQGLSSPNINALILNQGRIIATSNVGFDIIDIDNILKLELRKPTILMDSIIVNGKRYQSNQPAFDWNESGFAFYFSGICYNALENIRYKYRLSGVEDNWIYTDESSIRFPSLPAGNYVFEVIAISSENNESAPITYTFSIGQHYTQTWWFSALILFIVAVVIGLLVYRIQRRKTRKLEIEKQMANLEMNALQSQMNPHFVFNSLNSIQSVLFLKGERETNRYIGSFSKLIRQTLDNSKKGAITIQEEVDYLTTYLDLETRRLDGELIHSIELGDDLELEETIIPCMIVQPMVENAILHGLAPKKFDRQLVIRFIKKDNQLEIEVEDNGIGREEAGNNSRQKSHNSWASTILQERLEVLNKINMGKVTCKIVDLTDGKNATGTLIQIQLPLNYVD